MGNHNRKQVPIGPIRVVYLEREDPTHIFYELENGFRKTVEIPELMGDWIQKEWEKFTSKQGESDAPGG